MYRNANRSTGVKVQTYKCHCRGTTYGLRIHTHYLYHALKQAIENRNTVANAAKNSEVERKSFRSSCLFQKHSAWEVRSTYFQFKIWDDDGKGIFSIQCLQGTGQLCLYSIMGPKLQLFLNFFKFAHNAFEAYTDYKSTKWKQKGFLMRIYKTCFIKTEVFFGRSIFWRYGITLGKIFKNGQK